MLSQTQNVKVTIGLCVKNSQATIKPAVSSILSQDYPANQMELIVVDGYSKDQTVEIIKSCLTAVALQTRFFSENHGLGQARQTVIENAVGSYVVWVDGDMELPSDFVRKQVLFMDANPSVGIGKARYGIDKDAKLVASLENIEFLINYQFEGETHLKYLGTSGCIYRIEAIRQAGGFDITFRGVGEDMDAEYRVHSNGWKLYVTDAVFVEHRRDSWRSLWDEYFWHGYGFRFLLNKNRDMVNIGKMLPPVAVLAELRRVPEAYRLTGQKIVVLLPFHYVFKRIAWFLGFLKSRRQT
ncbi:MAG: glycosyltransferase [Candidatus Bathyarchaeota archaeon]|nr:glycosyltransferase [Candidatus Termiticorpusculum sp.]